MADERSQQITLYHQPEELRRQTTARVEDCQQSPLGDGLTLVLGEAEDDGGDDGPDDEAGGEDPLEGG